MECKKCGAELPYNVYGDVKCQFCNAQNHIPIPEKEVSKGGIPISVLIVLIVIIGGVSAYTFLGANSGSSSKVSSYSTPRPTYSTPVPTTTSYITPTTAPPPTTTPPTTTPPTTTPAPKCRETQVPYTEEETTVKQVPYEDEECSSREPKVTIDMITTWCPFDDVVFWECDLEISNHETQAVSITAKYYWSDANTNNLLYTDTKRLTLKPLEVRTVTFNSLVSRDTGTKRRYGHVSDFITECKTVTKFKSVSETRTVTKYRTETVCE